MRIMSVCLPFRTRSLSLFCRGLTDRCVDEFGQWMPAQSGFDKRYLDAYYVGDEISEPTEDFEGRLDLYKLWVLTSLKVIIDDLSLIEFDRRFNAHVSALFPNDKRLRVQ
jgi:hypothetical protein